METAGAQRLSFQPDFLQTLSQPKSGGPRSEWEEQLDNLLSELNPGRVAAGFKPYTHARLGKILNDAGIHDAAAAYRLYRRCKDGRSFTRLFAHLTRKV